MNFVLKDSISLWHLGNFGNCMENLLSTQLACREVKEACHPNDFCVCDAHKDYVESCKTNCDAEKVFFETCKCIFIQSK